MPIDTEARKRDSTDPVIALITVDHADLSEPARIAANGEDLVSDGATFHGLPVELTLPDEGEEADYEAAVVFDNGDPAIVPALIASPVAPTVAIDLVMGSAPDDVEQAVGPMGVKEIVFDAATIEGRLSYPDFRTEAVCQFSFVPTLTPGLF